MEEILAGCVYNKKFVNITFHGSCAEFSDVYEVNMILCVQMLCCFTMNPIYNYTNINYTSIIRNQINFRANKVVIQSITIFKENHTDRFQK